MIDIKHNRRFFLKGTAGLALAIPALPSLLSAKAYAEIMTTPPRLVTIPMRNGGMIHSSWYPQNSDFGPEIELYASQGHTIRESEILLKNGLISKVFDSKFAKYKDTMNFLKGIDGMFDYVHHSGWLGNFAACNVAEIVPALTEYPSIDAVVAYARDAALKQKMMIFTNGSWRHDHFSYGWEGNLKSPSAITKLSAISLTSMFDNLFKGAAANQPNANTEKVLAVDSVYEAFKRVIDGRFGVAKRISSEDKNKLSEHMQKIFEIEKQLLNVPKVCSTEVVIPNLKTTDSKFISGNPARVEDDYKVKFQVYIDIIVEAFSCDVSRVASIDSIEGGTLFSPTDYHDYTHNMHSDINYQTIGENYKKFVINNLVYPLIEKLSAKTDPNGKSILENSLVCVFDESGQVSHTNDSTPLVTFGSAGGYFETGKYVDYRHTSTAYRNFSFDTLDGKYKIRHGIPMNRFLATVLQSMGLEPSVWERAGHKGHGEIYISGDERSGLGGYKAADYRPCYKYQLDDLSKKLPLIIKT